MVRNLWGLINNVGQETISGLQLATQITENYLTPEDENWDLALSQRIFIVFVLIFFFCWHFAKSCLFWLSIISYQGCVDILDAHMTIW